MSPPTTNIDCDRGDDIKIVIGPVKLTNPVTGSVDPVDLTTPGLKLWLTAKDKLSDTDANARVRLGSAGTTLSGITLNSPATSDKNYATAIIPAAATESLPDRAVDIPYDVQLVDGANVKTTLQRGELRFGPDVTRA